MRKVTRVILIGGSEYLSQWVSGMPEPLAKILIVDDKAIVRTTMSDYLGEIGYRVRTSQNGRYALREILDEIPDILIADLHMPGMSGFELLRVVRRRFPKVLVIAMSGASVGNEVPSGVLADAFFQKGSSIAALLTLIATPSRMCGRDCRQFIGSCARLENGAISPTSELSPESLKSF